MVITAVFLAVYEGCCDVVWIGCRLQEPISWYRMLKWKTTAVSTSLKVIHTVPFSVSYLCGLFNIA